MPTRPETLQFLLDQLASLPGVRVSKTFGEYCLYVDGRSVGFVCNDQLFLKPTDAGRAVLGQPVLGGDALHAAVMATAGALPCPKPRKPKAAAR